MHDPLYYQDTKSGEKHFTTSHQKQDKIITGRSNHLHAAVTNSNDLISPSQNARENHFLFCDAFYLLLVVFDTFHYQNLISLFFFSVFLFTFLCFFSFQDLFMIKIRILVFVFCFLFCCFILLFLMIQIIFFCICLFLNLTFLKYLFIYNYFSFSSIIQISI